MAMAKKAIITVIAPVPWVPSWLSNIFPRYAKFSGIAEKETDDSLEVYHPRFLTFPKVFKSLDGLIMAASVCLFLHRKRIHWDFDLIDAHWLYPDGTAALLLGKTFKTPTTVTVRGDDIRTFSRYFFRRMQLRYTLKKSDWVWVVCEDLKKWISRIAPGISHVEITLNGVDTKKFHPLDRQECRRGLGLSENCTVLISVGRIEPAKGQALLLDALSILQAGGGNYLLALVGPVDDERYSTEMRERVRRDGLMDRVIWAGPIGHETLVEWLCSADLFLMASENEGCPNSLMEAMACQLPVVATAVGGIPEVIRAGAGCVFVERKGEGFARGIEEMTQRKEDREKMAGMLHGDLRSWDKVATQIMDRLAMLA
jgi:glycosyltransferase involved in cell wall biosynthesis